MRGLVGYTPEAVRRSDANDGSSVDVSRHFCGKPGLAVGLVDGVLRLSIALFDRGSDFDPGYGNRNATVRYGDLRDRDAPDSFTIEYITK